MNLRQILVLILCLMLLPLTSFTQEAATALTWKAKSLTISYNEKLAEYHLDTVAGEKRVYPRHRYTQLITDLQSLFAINDVDLEQSLTNHALLKRLEAPTSEEILEQGFKAQSLALDIMSLSTAPCGGEGRELKGPSRYSLFLAPKESFQLSHQIIEQDLAEDGFFPLGKLTGMKVEISSSNDNPLHGGTQALGLTEHNEGIDGDDRGKTFGIGGELAFEFEEGELVIRRTSTGFGKLKPQGSKYILNGKEYETFYKKDADGKTYQEFMSVDGLELEIRKELGYKDVYVRVSGKYETTNDQSGLSKVLQEKWHAMQEKHGTVQYHYLNHTRKETHYEAGVALGRDFIVVEGDGYMVRSDASLGLGLSTHRNFSNVSTAMDIRIQSFDGSDKDNRYPGLEARVYAGVKAHRDREVDRMFGAEITGRVQVSKNGFLYMRMGIAHEDDRYSRIYGQEEYQRHGRFDFQHHLAVGYEFRF